MDIKQFKSGRHVQQYQYRSFVPSSINHEWMMNDSQLLSLLSKADIKLGELNAFSELVPDIDFFIQVYATKEATLSNRIEGTKTSFEEALQPIEFIDPEKKDDWTEVQNYIKAMNNSIAELKKLPLSNRLIKYAHNIILNGVRGKNKTPGEFRHSQNWIGGATISDAVFIPPHHDHVTELMSDLEKFIHNDDIAVPDLIKIGILHYQFETIHPFLDGNGRVGRLLITLYLVYKGILTKPTLYLSDFLEKHKAQYYDHLTQVRLKNDLTEWLKFFLEGVYKTSENSIQTFRSIIALRKRCEEKILSTGKTAKALHKFLHYLFKRGTTDSQTLADDLSVNRSTALRFINQFVELDILSEMTGFKRNRIFIFEEYAALFEK